MDSKISISRLTGYKEDHSCISCCHSDKLYLQTGFSEVRFLLPTHVLFG